MAPSCHVFEDQKIPVDTSSRIQQVQRRSKVLKGLENLGDLFELRILRSMWSEFQRIFTLPWLCSLWVFKPPCRFRKVQDVQEDANKTFFKDMLVWICWRCVSSSCWVH